MAQYSGTPQLRDAEQVCQPSKPQRLDVLLTADLVDWLDEQAAAIRKKTGSKPNRSELLRFTLEALRHAEGPAEWI